MLRVATWNVNSIRVRLPRLLAWLARTKPDVLCLQELKCTEANFPFEALQEAGYAASVYGQKTYNGVALLSRQPATEVQCGFAADDDPQARLIAGVVQGVRVVSVYVPNGSHPDSDKYAYKLDWLARFERWLKAELETGHPLIVGGDFNIAPTDLDVASPATWQDSVLCHEAVRTAWQRLLALGLVDVFRQLHRGAAAYSWWDYRQLAFARGEGLRIDHVLASAPLTPRLQSAHIDRDERKGSKPSDHAPVITTFDQRSRRGA
ncbi:MAG: exodeoxyribonuclease III [Polyangiales bacterium]